MNQITHPNSDTPGRPSATSTGDVLSALSLITEALDAMVRADCLEIEERQGFIEDFEREADLALGALLAEFAAENTPSPSFLEASSAARDCCAALLLAHRSCIGLPGHDDYPDELGRGLLRCAGKFLKWQALSRGPAHAALWAWIDAALDMLRSAAPETVRGYGRNTFEDLPELVQLLTTATAAYDRVPPALVPAVDRVLARFMSQFSISASPETDYLLAYHEGARSAPVRPRVVGVPSESTLYFSVRFARESAALCEAALHEGRSATMLGFPDLETGQLQAALSHLAGCWNPEKSRRRSRRHAIDTESYLVHGLEAIQLALGDGLPPVLARCRLVDISKHGARVLTTRRRSAPLKIDDLVAFRPSDARTWHIGQVRRIWHEGQDEVSIGIETLALHAQYAQLDDGRSAHDAVICGAVEHGRQLRIILPAGWRSKSDTLFLSADNTVRKLSMESHARLNDDTMIGVFRVL